MIDITAASLLAICVAGIAVFAGLRPLSILLIGVAAGLPKLIFDQSRFSGVTTAWAALMMCILAVVGYQRMKGFPNPPLAERRRVVCGLLTFLVGAAGLILDLSRR